MQPLLANPSTGIKIIFGVHITLITFASQSGWLPNTYLFYNFFFLSSLLWVLHAQQSEDSLYVSTGLSAACIVYDSVLIGMYYFSYPRNGFSIFCSIVNLMLRVLTTLTMFRYLNDKTGRYSHFVIPGFDEPLLNARTARPGNRSAYEVIEPTNSRTSNVPTLSPESPINEPPHIYPTNYQDYRGPEMPK